jgi:hypothetical protein
MNYRKNWYRLRYNATYSNAMREQVPAGFS